VATEAPFAVVAEGAAGCNLTIAAAVRFAVATAERRGADDRAQAGASRLAEGGARDGLRLVPGGHGGERGEGEEDAGEELHDRSAARST